MKKGKIIVLICAVLLLALAFAGCGAAANAGDAPITAKWKLREFSVNGNTTVIADENLAVRIITAKDNPSFSCRDGVNCTFTNGGKTHEGTITQEDGKYIISYNDTSRKMIGEIQGNTLTIVNDKGTLEFVFDRK